MSRSLIHRDGRDLDVVVRAAVARDERAWEILVARFEPAIRAVARRHRLDQADQDEVVQRTWLRLVERIDAIRNPGAIAGWLVTTAGRESLRVQQVQAREIPEEHLPETGAQAPVEDAVIAAERSRAVHRALTRLPRREGTLLQLQLIEPALGYSAIGGALGMPVGSIGPTRGRSLARLRRDAQLAGALAAA